MERQSGADYELKPFIEKLVHPLEEIRVRALDGIVQKLKYGLIDERDLIQEKELLGGLLKWFSFPNCRKQEECLQLLERLAKHDSAVQLLCSLGAVGLLGRLRKDLPTRLHALLDSVLEQLLLLPADVVAKIAPGSNDDDDDGEQFEHPSLSVDELPADRNSDFDLSAERMQRQQQQQSSATVAVGSSAATGRRAATNASTEVLTPASTADANASDSSADHVRLSETAVTYFPWLQLTATDHHVLQSTNDSLASGNRALIISACEFFVDVILYDFPVEVFLQQPDIVKSLLRLIADPPGKDSSLVAAALSALLRLTSAFKVRVRMHADAGLKQKQADVGDDSLPLSGHSADDGSGSSTASRRSLVGSSEIGSEDGSPAAVASRGRSGHHGYRHGHGQPSGHSSTAAASSVVRLSHGNVSTSTAMLATASEIGLRSAQLSVPEFCLTSSRELLHAVPNCSSFKLAVKAARTLLALYDLLTATGGPLAGASRTADESLREQLGSIVCHRMAAAALHWHREQSILVAAAASGSTMTAEQRQHLFVVLSCLSLKYLETFISLGKAAEEMPPKVKDLLGVLAFEEALLRSLPDARRIVVAYLPMVDSGHTLVLYEGVQVLAASMKKTCAFLLETADGGGQRSEEQVAELVNMAEQSLFSLPYHQDLEIVSAYCHFYATLFDRAHLYDGTQRYAIAVMLKLLSHPLLDVRRGAYKTSLKILKACLALENAGTASTRRVSFLANQDVLKEVIYFGLEDSLAEIRKCASDIICHILQSKALLADGLWDAVLTVVVSLLPVLQAHSSHDTLLGRCVIGLITSESVKGALSKLQRLKATLRGLLLKDDITRRGLSKVLPSLIEPAEDDVLGDVPASILVKHEPSAGDEFGDTGGSPGTTSSFDESFSKLYAIIESRTVDKHLRVSAAEQLAVLLRDPVLHKSFVRRGGLDFVCANVNCTARPKTESSIQPHSPDLLLACARMLCRLLHHDVTLRNTLGNDKLFMEDVLRCIVRHGQHDEQLSALLTQALVYLLFEDVSQMSTSGRYCLPKIVSQRYRLPMYTSICCETSSHVWKVPPASDPLRGVVPLEALRFCWSSAVYGSTRELLLAVDSDAYCLPRSPAFLIAEQCVPALRAACPAYVVRRCLDSIANATTHRAVHHAVQDLAACSLVAKLGGSADAFSGVSWKRAFGRFFATLPRAPADEELLADILGFMQQFISLDLLADRSSDDDAGAAVAAGSFSGCSDAALREVVDVCSSGSYSLMTCIVLPPLSGPAPCSRRSLQNDLLEILCCHGVRSFPSCSRSSLSHDGCCSHASLEDRCRSQSGRWRAGDDSCKGRGSGSMPGNIVRLLLQKLTLADAANFYNLAALESIITALMHVTASRQGWSNGATDVNSRTLCYQLLDSLFEVLSAFNVDKQGLATSYMGKGVIRSAALCLLNTIHELLTVVLDESWIDGLLLWRQNASRATDSPRTSADVVDHLSWMVPLWAYQSSAEVRAAAFAAAAAIVSSSAVSSDPKSASIMWQAAESSVSNASECSMVKHQAVSVLCGIARQLMEKADKKKPPQLRQDERDIVASVRDGGLVQRLCGFLQNYLNDIAIVDLVQMVARASGHGGGSSSSPSAAVARAASAALADALETAFVGDACRLLASLRHLAPDVVCAAVSQLDLHSLLSRLALTVTHLPACDDASTGGVAGVGLDGLRRQCTVACVSHVLGLLQQCAPDGASLRRQLLAGDSAALDELVVMLAWRVADGNASDLAAMADTVPVRAAACALLSSLLVLEEQAMAALQRLLPLLVRLWPDFVVSCLVLLSSKLSSQRKAAMELLLLLTSLEEKRLFAAAAAGSAVASLSADAECPEAVGPHKSQLTAALDTLAGGGGSSIGEETASGWLLCKQVLAIYDSLPLSRYSDGSMLEDRTLTALLLSGLIGMSRTAKACAFKMGLIETVLEHSRGLMKEVDSLPAPLKANRPVLLALVSEALLSLGLLCSFVLGSSGEESHHSESAEAVLRADIGSLVQALWPWCSDLSSGGTHGADSRLTLALLASTKRLAESQHRQGTSHGHTTSGTQQCLVVASSRRTDSPECGGVSRGSSGACSSCCATHAAVAQLVVRIASTEWSRMHPDVGVLREAMAAVSVLALQPSMISYISKSNIAAGFLAVNPREASKSKKHYHVALLWLRFFLNLSFSAEGQQVVLKHRESLPILVELGCSKEVSLQEMSLIVLCNLASTSFGGQRLLTNENFCSLLHLVLQSASERTAAVVLEMVSSLLKDSAKSKVLLKSSGLSQSLSEVASRLHAAVAAATAEQGKSKRDVGRCSQLAETRRLLDLASRLQESLR